MKPRIRRTEFENLLRCPSWENDGSELAQLGTDAHECFAAITRAAQSGTLDAASLAAIANGFGDDVRELADRFAETHSFIPEDQPEVTLEREEELAVLCGTIDRLTVRDNGATVCDYKSGWHPVPHGFQLRWYGALVAYTYPAVEWVTLATDYVRLNGNGWREETFTADELLTWWDDEIVPNIPRVLEARANGGSPKGGSACQFCRKRKTCAASIAPYRDAPANEDEALDMAQQLVRLQEAAKAYEAGLRLWMEDREPMHVNGLSVGFTMTKGGTTVDTAAARAAGLVKPSEPKPVWGFKKAEGS